MQDFISSFPYVKPYLLLGMVQVSGHQQRVGVELITTPDKILFKVHQLLRKEVLSFYLCKPLQKKANYDSH